MADSSEVAGGKGLLLVPLSFPRSSHSASSQASAPAARRIVQLRLERRFWDERFRSSEELGLPRDFLDWVSLPELRISRFSIFWELHQIQKSRNWGDGEAQECHSEIRPCRQDASSSKCTHGAPPQFATGLCLGRSFASDVPRRPVPQNHGAATPLATRRTKKMEVFLFLFTLCRTGGRGGPATPGAWARVGRAWASSWWSSPALA